MTLDEIRRAKAECRRKIAGERAMMAKYEKLEALLAEVSGMGAANQRPGPESWTEPVAREPTWPDLIAAVLADATRPMAYGEMVDELIRRGQHKGKGRRAVFGNVYMGLKRNPGTFDRVGDGWKLTEAKED